MNKKQLIEWLLNDDCDSFDSDYSGENWAWMKYMLTNGFKGYEKMTVIELKDEVYGRKN